MFIAVWCVEVNIMPSGFFISHFFDGQITLVLLLYQDPIPGFCVYVGAVYALALYICYA